MPVENFKINNLDLAGIDHIQAGIFDINGVMRGKRLPVSSYQKIINKGIQIPLSAQNIDIFGGDIQNSKFVFETGDKDGTARWQGASLVKLLHLAQPILLIPLGLTHQNGSSFAGCPRAYLKSVMDMLKKNKRTVKCGIELEFCLTSDNSELKILSQPQSLSLLALDSIDQFLRDIQQITNQLGITIESALSEAGIGQIELVLAPQTDLVQLADAILILKHSLLAYAQAKGMSVSFKAKPDKHLSGNGMHCHLSIEDSNLENLFAKDEVSFKAAIAGILNILTPATAILAPLPESYDRFQENSHAPTNIGWGYDNRTVAVRVPQSPPEAKRFELRVAGIDCNPYLLFGILVSSMIDGINTMLVPPPPVSGNGYEAELDRLPTDLATAISLFEKSRKIHDFMPETLRQMYVATKNQEIRIALSGEFDEKK
ncbi:glutamine synthetase family protein [Alphaproteobacteria bacterium]|jgi:glutamine synthetase|nr:glutamine synthetase [Alphaproteobacteria bacterium]MDA9190004.1 glutamine synthetase family protein [Alphaproteobacteria bacterium]MDA9815730.1 glutamine synthetase family protein [Alphaproteobacteria bacterium]MDC0461556.1 glutamine synthetase family protein [Alphaproteobacteria bacterium]